MGDVFGGISRALKPGLLWSTALFAAAEDWRPGDALDDLRLLLDTKARRGRRDQVHTRADPFLFVQGSTLYLFVEVQRVGGRGAIEAYRTADLVGFDALGVILEAPHHLSYPFVFEVEGAPCLIPESVEAGAVTLYGFEDFPRRPRPIRTLLSGAFADSSALFAGDRWYLFTTSERGLELFTVKDILRDPLVPHPASPVTDDPRFRRGGGAPFEMAGGLYRPAQDGSGRYGGNLNLAAIEALSPEAYAERPARIGLFDGSRSWNRLGGHHMSVARFAGHIVVAVDGLQADYRLNKLRRLLG